VKQTISQLLALQEIELQSPKSSKTSALRAQIPAGMLDRFDRFLSRGKKGVALVQNSICRGCQIAVPVGVVNALIQGVGVQVCDNCGRYLYLADTDATAFRAGTRADTITVTKRKAPSLAKKTVRTGRKTREVIAQAP
jgi:predicted  nucleic acid-binding Zn-ribbon protein